MAPKQQTLDVSAVVDDLLAEFSAEPVPARATRPSPRDDMQRSAQPEWMKRLTKGKTK